MRWVLLLAFAIVGAPVSTSAQNAGVLRGYGPYRFGMTIGEALEADARLQQSPIGGDDLVLLINPNPVAFDGVPLKPLVSFRFGRLSSIAYSGRGLVADHAQCGEVLARVVAALEPTVGPMAGAAGLSEYGSVMPRRNTPGGSTIRFYEFEAFNQSNGFANRRDAGWVEASSRSAPHANAPPDAKLCEIDLEFRETAPPTFEPLTPPASAQLSQARLLADPTWLMSPTSDHFELTLPRLFPSERVPVNVALDCLVLRGGLLNCTVVDEAPPGRSYGEFALRLSRFYRLAEAVGGEATVGRRVQFPVSMSLGPAEALPASPPRVDFEELRALAEQAPTRAELDGAALIERPTWSDRPAGPDFVRHYPAAALAQGLSGRAVLECLVLYDGSLRCAIAEEEPLGAEFGLAAIGIARSFRMALEVNGVATVGKRVRVPIRFNLQ